MNNSVVALTMYGGDLIAGGYFTEADSTPCSRVARWDGASWSPIGSGLDDGGVQALAVYHGDLVAGGGFTQAGGVPVNNIARWNGTSWQPFGSGTNQYVLSLLACGDTLLVGGAFTQAGNKLSSHIAAWVEESSNVPDAPTPDVEPLVRVTRIAPNPSCGATEIYLEAATPTHVNIAIFTAGGRWIRTLTDCTLTEGQHVRSWDGRDDAGREVGSGVYFCRVSAGGRAAATKIVLLR